MIFVMVDLRTAFVYLLLEYIPFYAGKRNHTTRYRHTRPTGKRVNNNITETQR